MAERHYWNEARRDARDTLSNFADEIAEQAGAGVVSNDLLNDYHGGDSWHHTSHVDRSYNLRDAGDVLDQLSDHEETDEGLWNGMAPREAVSAQAAYTYGNAVYQAWRDYIEDLNNNVLNDDDLNQDERWRQGMTGLYVHLVADLDADEPPPAGEDVPVDFRHRHSLAAAALADLRHGSTAGTLIFADWCEDHKEEQRARRLRADAARIVQAQADHAAGDQPGEDPDSPGQSVPGVRRAFGT